ncbi:MAG: PKD domain-containing protein, partial [Candidatus Thiodiazotropha sp. (ex Dulcina madagascariensis)]|nr:PKD domain-containing protein [Candidatus Thiodiazotropha sp. (ex Dulcina madagascariensis)]
AATTATIGAGNQPPTADPNGPYTGTSGTPVAFDGSGSTDSDGTIVSYTWDFGDGATGTGMAPSHTYTTQGTYNVTLTVTDDGNAVDAATTSATIDAANQAPTANPNGPYSGTVGVALSFDGTGSSDPDGTIVAYAWDFGDGTSGTGSTPSHTYASAGTYNVTLSVTDDGGLSNTATTTVAIGSVTNLPPVAVANGPYSGTVGLPVSFDSTGSNDPDGTLATYHWDFGDGATATGANPTYAYTAQGTYSVTLTVTDNEGAMGSDTTTATIGVGNQAPVAVANGPYSATVNLPVQFDSTGSSDPDGAIVAYDWDFGDGTAGTGPNPSHTYATPGTYNVTLTVMDGEGAMDSDATTATISPVSTGADVYLSELWAPESVKIKTGKKKSLEIVALGSGTAIRQHATVTLSVTNPSSGLIVAIEDASITKRVRPSKRRSKQFEFEVDLTCKEAGTYTLAWSATISADQNSDPSNDTLTGVTSVRCKADSDDDDDHDDDDGHDGHDGHDGDDGDDGHDGDDGDSDHDGDRGSVLIGMHPVGDTSFASGGHKDFTKQNTDACKSCHGADGLGTMMSTVAVDRVLKCDERTSFCPDGKRAEFPQGYRVGCVECHKNEIN